MLRCFPIRRGGELCIDEDNRLWWSYTIRGHRDEVDLNSCLKQRYKRSSIPPFSAPVVIVARNAGERDYKKAASVSSKRVQLIHLPRSDLELQLDTEEWPRSGANDYWKAHKEALSKGRIRDQARRACSRHVLHLERWSSGLEWRW